MVVERNGYNYLTQQLEQRVLVLLAHPEEISKLAKVKALVTKMKGVVMENIEKALDRSEKIEILVDLRSKYSNLPFHSYAQVIITPITEITRKMWYIFACHHLRLGLSWPSSVLNNLKEEEYYVDGTLCSRDDSTEI
ncbi:unnamed protein product [Arabidopsis thaliana]|uniref:V-SNARE coiled-coil homology domain-containing protein n=1 Tax=Arabidopsis thaliana TaxID=3702 RepID=A0A654FFU1_ARATH|nr:unnamed protein product [Arabidopsis thaliana]